ncbi:hypothetical protein Tco_0031009 [Tanacetum coccineum]
MVRVGCMTYFQDHKWYDELTDGKLKEEALMHKARFEESWGNATPGVMKFYAWLKSSFKNFHEVDYDVLVKLEECWWKDLAAKKSTMLVKYRSSGILSACCVASSGGIAWRCVSLQAMIEYSSRPEELRPNYLRDKVSSWYRRRSPCGSNHDCLWPWDVCIPSSCVATGVSGLEQRQAARHDWSRAHGAILAVAAVPPE